jgi:hypothetical protein
MAEEVDALPRPLLRQDVVIVSKAGYIQGIATSVACNEVRRLTGVGVAGKTLHRFQSGEFRVPESDVITYSTDCLHSIHPNFIRYCTANGSCA